MSTSVDTGSIKVGAAVEHRTDAALGQGEVLYARIISGVQQVGVLWSGADAPRQHTASELAVVQSRADRLKTVGPASRIRFSSRSSAGGSRRATA